MGVVRVPLLAAALVGLTAARHPSPPPSVPAIAAPVAPSIKAGVEKWRAGDYPAAVAMWQPFANAGDPDALFNMGQAYKLGRGVPADAAMARDDYRKAAVKGHLPAQANLGIALFQVGEKPEAIKWLRTAADRGEARAQYVLGIAAFNGDGLPRSQALGYGYLLRAQANGLPQAVTALGSIAPGLSPADRTAGEAVAASLAAGTGVPTTLAAMTAPRLIAPAPAGPLKPLPGAPIPPVRASVGAEPGTVKPPQLAAQALAPLSAPARTVAVPGLPAGAPSSRPATAAVAPPRPAFGPAAAPVPPPSDAARLATLAATRTAPPIPAKSVPATSAPLVPVAAARTIPPVKPGQVDATVMAQGEGGARPTEAVRSSLPPSMAPAAVATSPASTPPYSIASAATPAAPIATVAIPASKPATPALPPAASVSPTGIPAPLMPLAAAKPVATASAPPAIAPARPAAAKPVALEGAKRPVDPATAQSAVTLAAKLPPRPALRPFETVIPEPSAVKPTGWRVQLGAFSARKLADNAWAEIKASAAPAKPIFATDGLVTKLQMGPFASRDAAKTACAKLTAAGRACFVTQG